MGSRSIQCFTLPDTSTLVVNLNIAIIRVNNDVILFFVIEIFMIIIIKIDLIL